MTTLNRTSGDNLVRLLKRSSFERVSMAVRDALDERIRPGRAVTVALKQHGWTSGEYMDELRSQLRHDPNMIAVRRLL